MWVPCGRAGEPGSSPNSTTQPLFSQLIPPLLLPRGFPLRHTRFEFQHWSRHKLFKTCFSHDSTLFSVRLTVWRGCRQQSFNWKKSTDYFSFLLHLLESWKENQYLFGKYLWLYPRWIYYIFIWNRDLQGLYHFFSLD